MGKKTGKRKSKSAELTEQSAEHLPLSHDRFFTETFKTKRLAKGFLRRTLPVALLDRLDLDGLTVEPRHLTDEVHKEFITDVVYRVPMGKGIKTDSPILSTQPNLASGIARTRHESVLPRPTPSVPTLDRRPRITNGT